MFRPLNDYNDLYKKLGVELVDDQIVNSSVVKLSDYLAEKSHIKMLNNSPQVDGFDIAIGEKAIQDFITQIYYYEHREMGLGVISADNIFVIDTNIFLIGNVDLLPKVDKYYVNITKPYSRKDIYLPPELKENNVVPFKLRHISCYYSLGKIVNHLIFNTPNPSTDLQKVLHFTKLYDCLRRATQENINHRYLLYI